MNSFLVPTHLDTPLLPCRAGWRIVWLRRRLWLAADRQWWLETATGPVTVLLLRHKSFWWQTIAGITLQTADSEHRVLWLFRRGNSAAWRRMRVHFRHP